MKSHTVTGHVPPRGRLTRRERRARERDERKRHATPQAHRFLSVQVVGGGLTVLLVLAAFFYGLLRSSHAPSAARPALADTGALNPAPSLLQKGSRAPDFTLRDTDGTAYNLAAMRGHPVLLEFFAVWCPICQGEAPIMARITRDYGRKGVRVWGILANPYGQNYEISGRNDQSPATAQDLTWYARTFHVRHPQLVDPQFATVNRYGVSAYPGIYVIDGKGTISFAASGHQSYKTLAAALNRALAAGKGR